MFGGTWEALNSGNQVKISQAEGNLAVLTGSTHDVNSVNLLFKLLNNTDFNPAQTQYLGAYRGNGALVSLAIGTEPPADAGIVPDNLWVDTGTALKVYMWKRVA